MQFGDEAGGDSSPPVNLPATSVVAMALSGSVNGNPPAPVFHPLAYRSVVAEWTLSCRESWGRRANALEEQGLSWRDAETQAFIETWNEIRGHQVEDLSSSALEFDGADRNERRPA